MSSCKESIDRISSIIDGEASVGARVSFHAHMALCSPCRRYFQQFKTVKEAAGQVTEADLPHDFEDVMKCVMDVVEGAEDAG